MANTAETVYDKLTNLANNVNTVNDASNQVDAHRELIFRVKPGQHTSFLKLKDEQFTWYNIPLGKTKSRPNASQNSHENILVPILPLMYTTPDCDPKKAGVPRVGYLYIFRGDYLWRELEVLDRGYVKDINLRVYQGKDRRAASTERDNRILVPYKVSGKTERIWMCFSEIQWSWARINSMGGMDPKDFRINKDKPPKSAPDMGISKTQAADNRTLRMQEIDLSGCNSGFPVTLPAGKKSRIENVNSTTSKSYHLKLHKSGSFAAVYLHDPLGIALSNMQRYYEHQVELMNEMEMAKGHEHFKTAVISYRTFYDKKLWKKAKRQRRQRGPSGYEKNSDTDTLLRDCAKEMDGAYISEEILAVKKRKKIRAKMRKAKTVHVEFLDARFNGKSLTGNNPDFVHIIPALLDYAELPSPYYPAFWSAVRGVIHFLNIDPCQFDSAMDLADDVKQEKGKAEEDIGVKYLISLLKPDDAYKEKLHKALFPSKGQIDEYKKEFKFDGRKSEEPNGKGEYRAAALAASINEYKNPPRELMKNIEDSLKEPDKIIADFIYCFTKQWELTQKGKVTVDVDVLFRLAKGTNIPEIKGAVLVDPGSVVGDRVIVSGDVTIYEKLSRSQRREMTEASVKGKKSDVIRIVEPGTNTVIMTTEIAQLPNYKGIPLKITHEDWMEVFRKLDSDGTVRARAKLVVVPTDNAYAIKWHIPEAKTTAGVSATVKVMKAADKGLPPVLAVFEAWNLISSVSKLYKKGFNPKDAASTIISLIGLSFAIVDVTARLAGNEAAERLVAKVPGAEKLAKYMYKKPLEWKNFKLQGMATAGAAVAGLGAVMASWDAVENFMNDDDDAASAYVVQAVASLGIALAGLGQAGVAILAGFGPFGWAFLAVAIIAGIIAYMLTDTPLEKWAKHGPLSAEKDARFTAEYKDYKKFDAAKSLEALMSLLMRPRITVKADPAKTQISGSYKYYGAIVEVIAPGFKAGKSTLTIQATAQTSTSNARGQAHRTTSSQKEMIPYKIEPVYQDDKKINQIGCKYYYTAPVAKHVRFRARVQHKTEDQLIIPTLPTEDPKAYHPVEIDKEVPGWAYADSKLGRYKI